jgi:hypothetical protein
MFMVKLTPVAERRNLWAVLPGKPPLLINCALRVLMY